MIPQLYTPVPVSPMAFRLDFGSGVVSMGSCFADEVGQRLQRSGFKVELNPFGTLYNPSSIAAALQRMVEDREITVADIVEHEGLWHSWHHHGSFSRHSIDDTLRACNDGIHQAHIALRDTNLLMVTFGTAWVFERVPGGEVVANCHKLPQSMFIHRMMSVGEIVEAWNRVVSMLAEFNPALSVLFTVSPIRHMADGAHGNQLSKSTLLLAVDEIVGHNADRMRLEYFPAYEIVLDELRDYRFYASDMTHPAPLAVDVVWDRLKQACMSPSVAQQAHNNEKQFKRQQHIPLH